MTTALIRNIKRKTKQTRQNSRYTYFKISKILDSCRKVPMAFVVSPHMRKPHALVDRTATAKRVIFY